MKKLGISVKKIRFLFLTHHHDDHAGFLNDLIRDSDAMPIAHE
ncbi:MAG: MBL fold metallo-hydrolase [Brevefilum sp.]|nr:MBL fold metallo-hydrolase [Brevefilum sp.]